ncbi:MAG: MerR family transcriptional regulator [Caldilineaceae bacterium]|nr:MerR family transcriptional regulator [Caldilineaceae bacterium]
MSDKTPTYNLKAVVRETGLKPDTLRAWERRYGVPAPQRTDSGHRLYSQHDIDTLKWLLDRQSEGMSISRAIELWSRLESEGVDPLQATITPGAHRHLDLRAAPAPIEQPALTNSDVVTGLRDAWVNACLAFDEFHAEQLLAQAFAVFPIEVVCLDLIQRGLAQIGDSWYRGKITVQQEHFASALALRRMEALLTSTPAPTRPGRIIVGCPPDEEHTFVPLMLSLLLRRRGWDVVYLGANVPLRSLESTLAAVRPSLVVLTAQQLHTAASLLEMAELLFNERVPLAFGGLVFTQVPELYQTIPGYYLGDRLDQATTMIEQVMTSLRPQPAQRLVAYDYKEALDNFRAGQAQIEARVWAAMEQQIPKRHLAMANQSLGSNIAAALELGNMNFLDSDIDWVEGLLVNHHEMPPEALDHYLEVYSDAVDATLDQRGYLVVDWFARLLGRQLPQHVKATSKAKSLV